MTLRFSTRFPKGKPQLNNEPTLFVQKIIKGLYVHELATKGELIQPFRDLDRPHFSEDFLYCDTLLKPLQELAPKIHDIRRKKQGRWHRGRDIHFKISLGAPYKSKTFNFAPVIPCTGTQDISIRYDHRKDPKESRVFIYVSGNELEIDEVMLLAVNNGFDSVKHFLQWFDRDFDGEIIHWTGIRYGVKNIEVKPEELGALIELPNGNVSGIHGSIEDHFFLQIKNQENQLLKVVMSSHLERDLQPDDIASFSTLVTEKDGNFMCYKFFHHDQEIGTVEGKITQEGITQITFDPVE